jgi:hypothetical protein
MAAGHRPVAGHSTASANGLAAPGVATKVILVGGLKPGMFSPGEPVSAEQLVALLGVYGDVMKVKKLKKSSASRPGEEQALVEMDMTHQACEARRFLSGFMDLDLRASRQLHVKDRAAQNFFGSPLHRHRGDTGPRYAAHLCPPGSTVHAARVPAGMTPRDVQMLFARHGIVREVKVLPARANHGSTGGGPAWQEALVDFTSAADAARAIVHLHGHESSPGGPALDLRFAAAEASLGPRVAAPWPVGPGAVGVPGPAGHGLVGGGAFHPVMLPSASAHSPSPSPNFGAAPRMFAPPGIPPAY